MVLRVCGAAQRWCDVILTYTCIVLRVVTLLFIYYAEACSATLYKASRLDFTDRLRPMSECPQFGMPAERRAQFRVPNVPRSRISESAPFGIYEHAQCRVFERTSLQRAYVIPCR